MSAVVCVCGGDMTVERVNMPDGRRRFTLTCDQCWDGLVEYTRRQAVEAFVGGEKTLIGYIDVPAAHLAALPEPEDDQ